MRRNMILAPRISGPSLSFSAACPCVDSPGSNLASVITPTGFLCPRPLLALPFRTRIQDAIGFRGRRPTCLRQLATTNHLRIRTKTPKSSLQLRSNRMGSSSPQKSSRNPNPAAMKTTIPRRALRTTRVRRPLPTRRTISPRAQQAKRPLLFPPRHSHRANARK